MRNPGYYWVKLRSEWTIARWAVAGELSMWLYSGYNFEDSDFEEIDERRIERELKLNAKELYEALDDIFYHYGTNSWSFEDRKKCLTALRNADEILNKAIK